MIKYICDNCDQEVYENEALGDGVVWDGPQGKMVGKNYQYVHGESSMVLTVSLSFPENPSGQYCFACMWNILKDMIHDFGPRTPVLDEVDKAKHLLDETGKKRLFPSTEWVEEMRQRAIVGEYGKETPNEETNPGTTEPDPKLHELYFEGVLSETSPDADSDTPGLDPYDRDVPNIGPNPVLIPWERTGWVHRSTANFQTQPLHSPGDGPGKD